MSDRHPLSLQVAARIACAAHACRSTHAGRRDATATICTFAVALLRLVAPMLAGDMPAEWMHRAGTEPQDDCDRQHAAEKSA